MDLFDLGWIRKAKGLEKPLRGDIRLLILLKSELDAEVELELLNDRTNLRGTWTKTVSARVEAFFFGGGTLGTVRSSKRARPKLP